MGACGGGARGEGGRRLRAGRRQAAGREEREVVRAGIGERETQQRGREAAAGYVGLGFVFVGPICSPRKKMMETLAAEAPAFIFVIGHRPTKETFN